MESIHQKVEAEYRDIRKKNEEERQNRIQMLYAKIPRLKELEEETYRTYSQLTAQLFENRELAEQHNHKIRSLQQEKKKLLRENGYSEDYLDTIYTCTTCQDRGYLH
ncbi:MAG: hypothetical protein E7399_08535, partial [Ruminococcaceae bacterium]|nr:hypothetical protein [Oscillospiraceae bacterium]